MTPKAADRNLLVGVLALQMDFVSRDGLIQAMNQWLLEKSKTLDEILRDKGLLAEDTQALLQALVEKHVSLHDNDVEASLKSLTEVPAKVHDVLSSCEDMTITHAVSQLSTKDGTGAQAAGEEPKDREPRPTDRYEVLQRHAEGGLGTVSVARDVELNREVALKEIKAQYAEDLACRSRFVMEAEVTARLEHPGVVPVYGFGTHSDGRPFYAMRFIRGESLKEASKRFQQGASRGGHQQALELRQLLGRFVAVCNAVEYAHSRGVLHRDLKPSNVMLGNYGETLVVDWGLAKMVGRSAEERQADGEQTLYASSSSGTEPTQMGNVLGTPAYMSPEQAAGRLDELGPLSDVYSLGATLYHVLTGKPPFHEHPSKSVLQKVQAGEFRPPGQVAPHVPPALAAVCLKAMATDPSDRYQSASQMVADIENWLADEPVSAYREGWLDRTRRWVNRHQTLVGSAASATLVAAMLLAVLALTLSGKNRELETAIEDLRQANVRERAAKLEAESSNEIAMSQRQLALSTLERVIYGIQDKLADFPAARPLRLSLLQIALEGLDLVASDLSSRTTVDLNAAKVYHELGRIFLRVGDDQGLGGIESAEEVFRASLEIVDQVYQQRSDDEQVMEMWATSHSDLGDALMRSGELEGARQHYARSMAVRKALLDHQPASRYRQYQLAQSHVELGDVAFNRALFQEALTQYQTALNIRESAASPRSLPDVADGVQVTDIAEPEEIILTNKAQALAKIADSQLMLANPQAALDAQLQVLEISEVLWNVHPENIDAKHAVADAHQELGQTYLRLRDLDEAQSHFLLDMEMASEIAAAEIYDTHHQLHLSASYMNLADLERQRGSLSKAIEYLELALDIRQRQHQASPSEIRPISGLALIYEKLGDVYVQLGQHGEAANQYVRQAELLEDLVSRDTTNGNSVRDLAMVYNRLGNLQLGDKDFEKAREQFREGLALIEGLLEVRPGDPLLRRDVSFSYNKIGDSYFHADDFESSLEFYIRAIEIRRQLANDYPDDLRGIQDLGVSLERVGNASVQLSRFDEALGYYEESLAIRKKLADKNPDDVQAQRYLAATYVNMASVEVMREDFLKALPLVSEGAEILEQLDRSGRLAPRYQSMLSAVQAMRQQCRDKVEQEQDP